MRTAVLFLATIAPLAFATLVLGQNTSPKKLTRPSVAATRTATRTSSSASEAQLRGDPSASATERVPNQVAGGAAAVQSGPAPSAAPCTLEDLKRDRRYDPLFALLEDAPRANLADTLEILLGVGAVGIGAVFFILRWMLDERATRLFTHAETVAEAEASVSFTGMYNDVAFELWQLARVLREEPAPSSAIHQEREKQAQAHLRAAIGLLANALKYEIKPESDRRHKLEYAIAGAPPVMSQRAKKALADSRENELNVKNGLAYILVERDGLSGEERERVLQLSREAYDDRGELSHLSDADAMIDTFIFVRLSLGVELEAVRAALDKWRPDLPARFEEPFHRYEVAAALWPSRPLV